VVGKLAARHGIRVTLRPSRDGGTTAWVLMPDNIVVRPKVTGGLAPHPARPAAAPRPAATPHPARPAAAPRPAEPAAAGAQDPAVSGPQPGAGTYRGLPRRVRQASLNPHLRQPPTAPDRAAAPGRPAPAADRSPEEARRLVSSLQRGWQRGREAEPAASQATGSTDAQATDERDARHDADAPRAGEA
jgi:hypothetical protein